MAAGTAHTGFGVGDELLRAITACADDGLYAVDAEGAILFANPAAVRLLGYDDESELLGRPSHALIHWCRPDGSPFPDAECPLLEPRRTGLAVHVEDDWFVRRDGTFVPVAYSSAPIATTAGRGAVVAFRDTTERRRAEEIAHAHTVSTVRNAELAAAGARLAEAVNATRRSVERDLHDGAQQSFSTVAVRLALATDPARVGALLDEALELQRTALTELRELAHGLHPANLETNGLASAIRGLARRSAIPVELALESEERFAPLIESTAYFVVAEALTNAARHAGATAARVTFATRDATAQVEVRDDGSGAVDESLGTGLRGLRDRVEALGGTFSVSGTPGEGTRIAASLPRRAPG